MSSDRFFWTVRNFANSLVLILVTIAFPEFLITPLFEKPALVEDDERGT